MTLTNDGVVEGAVWDSPDTALEGTHLACLKPADSPELCSYTRGTPLISILALSTQPYTACHRKGLHTVKSMLPRRRTGGAVGCCSRRHGDEDLIVWACGFKGGSRRSQ